MTPKEKAKLLEEINGWSSKEILQNIMIPEMREFHEKFDEFYTNDYCVFRQTFNRWRWVITGGIIVLMAVITTLGTLAAIYGNLDL